MDIYQLEDMVREANRRFITPRWNNLTAAEIHDTSRADACTAADEEAEAWITEQCESEDADIVVFGEEAYKKKADFFANKDLNKGKIIFVDPVDGTRGFINGDTNFGTMVAVGIDGQLTSAVIFNPIDNLCLTAVRSEGVRLNGMPLKPVTSHKMERTNLSYLLSYKMPAEKTQHIREHMDVLQARTNPNYKRPFSVAKRTLVAVKDLSRTNGFCEATCGYYTPWDYAAPALIFNELGGFVHQDGLSPLGYGLPATRHVVLASSRKIGPQVLAHAQQLNLG